MKLPRDLGGEELATRLGKYGYQVVRQTGSHIRLTSTYKDTEHHLTIPRHKPLRVGTLNGIINEVAAYLEMEKQSLIDDLSG
ncbi:MAG: type II toxin-antitoxin system HicA family toxin [Dehalococcoidales bacterium]|nr:type II toxin-antitoxin system HicA family toxin [Dehalococcoidales bacterium]